MTSCKTLALDVETYSGADIKKVGAYRYAADPDFEILLLSYSINSSPPVSVSLARGEEIPAWLIKALTDESVEKWAYNAQFERVCLSAFLGHTIDPTNWHCAAVQASAYGLPRSLDDVCKALQMPQDLAKMRSGKALVRYFCCPCKPTKTNGGRTRNYPAHDPDKWDLFVRYTLQDVVALLEVMKQTSRIPDEEQRLYEVDQRVNDNGVRIDQQLVDGAIKVSDELMSASMDEARKLTGLANPNSLSAVKAWLAEQGVEAASLDKEAAEQLRQREDLPEAARRYLELRADMGKTSVAKYQTMRDSCCPDGRCHGTLQFYGAGRTGRWAGRLIQTQNLPRMYLGPDDQDTARTLIKEGDRETLTMLYGSASDTLSQMIRSALIPANGRSFVVADYSAIEARVIAWYAQEAWRCKAFIDGKDIYCESASQMFHVPVVKGGVNGHLRQKGKVAELALGYGGGVGALINMGAIKMGLTEDELQPIVDAWRAASPRIVNFWWDVDRAAKKALNSGQATKGYGLRIYAEAGALMIQLPSGRTLRYPSAVAVDRQITFDAPGNCGEMIRVETRGAKLVENIVQATARDCLALTLLALDKAAEFKVVFHVHDEIVAECAAPRTSLERLLYEMTKIPPWATGNGSGKYRLCLRGDGYAADYYKKD